MASGEESAMDNIKVNTLLDYGSMYLDEGAFDKAYPYIQEAALTYQEPDAYELLGTMYLYGLYVDEDFEKAFKYFKIAYDISGMAKSLVEIIGYTDKLAESKAGRNEYIGFLNHMLENDKSIYILLGECYHAGKILPKDVNREIEMYEKAVENGEMIGAECLGELYLSGTDVPKDYEKAYKYFTSFDGFESFLKPYCLGEMYRNGYYVEKNLSKARDCFFEIIDSDRRYKKEDYYYSLAEDRLGDIMEEEAILNGPLDVH